MIDGFTKQQVEALRRLADREIELTEVLQLSGQLLPMNFRLDSGLIEAMKARAATEGITTSELVRRAVADYLAHADQRKLEKQAAELKRS